jgi:homoserine kinase
VTRVRVPGSTSNLGAGFDCLGLALDFWLEAELVPGDGEATYAGTVADLTAETDLVHGILAERGVLANRSLRVTSTIPVGKGLGSSGAAAVAAFALAGLDRDAVYREAVRLEGHPDNVGPAVYGGLVLAAHRPVRLALHRSLGIALAIPEAGVSTKAARAILPAEVPREVAVQQAARSAALVQGLVTGDADLIDFGMDDRLAVPHRKRMIPGYDAALEAGLDAGACGVTISGAGSTLVAVTEHGMALEVARALAAALTAAGTRAEPATPAPALEGLTSRPAPSPR